MNTSFNIKPKTLLYLSVFLFSACKGFLDEKSDKKLAEPATVENFQALLNETTQINISASEGEVASGDFYLTDQDFESLSCQTAWDLYLWHDGPLTELCDGNDGWRKGYTSIYNANTVLDHFLKNENLVLDQSWANIKGQAYFHRACNFLEMAGIWCNAYDKTNAGSELGLPLRLTSDFNEHSVRASLAETYQQILTDLKSSIRYLPDRQSTNWWPSKVASYGLLARTYLFMRDYDNALLYADSCLHLQSDLMDYHLIDQAEDWPFEDQGNVEVIFYKSLFSYYSLNSSIAKTDSNLYAQYDEEDMRKSLFFAENPDGSHKFKGSYRGGDGLFSGIATDEIYLIRAECSARKGLTDRAIEDINMLLKNRYTSMGYHPLVDGQEDLVDIILQERRKELIFRGLRWSDIKRLNKEGANISLSRNINGQASVLPVNDPRFTLLIPDDIIQISGMEQNYR